MKRLKFLPVLAAISLAVFPVKAEGSIGDAGIELDFNGDGVTDNGDWSAMKEWVIQYKMKDGNETNYGNQEVPASINLLIDRDYNFDAESEVSAEVSSVPQYYLTSLGDTTSIKDQSPFGTCWAFGTIAATESNMLHKRHGNAGVINPDGFEMNLDNVSKDLDLSELYHAYMNMEEVENGSQEGEGNRPLDPTAKNANLLAGGFSSASQVLLTSWTSPLTESEEPYKPLGSENGGASDIYGLRDPEGDKVNPRQAHVQEFVYFDSPSRFHVDTEKQKYIYDGYNESAVARIKQALVDYGALMLSYQADSSMPGDGGNSDYMNYEYFAQYDDSTEVNMNHMVTLVGWNDDYPRENFQSEKGGLPENNGAWLIKNSWGNYETSYARYGEKFLEAYESFSNMPGGKVAMAAFNYGIPDEEGHGTGYAWISYEDHSLFGMAGVDTDDAIDGFDYDHIYQYDFTNPVSLYPISLPTNNEETRIANIFTSERDETLAAVSVYAPVNNVRAEIEVYRLTKDDLDPTAGELLYADSAEFASRGFYTVKLNEPADLRQGDRFAIVQKITSEKDGKSVSWLNIEETIREDLQTKDNINEETVHVRSNPGETLICVNNGSEQVWADATELTNTAAGSVMAFGNAYIKAYTVTPEHAPLSTADATYQGVYEGDTSAMDTVLLYSKLPKIIMWAGIGLLVIIALIIFLIVRHVRKKKRAKKEVQNQ